MLTTPLGTILTIAALAAVPAVAAAQQGPSDGAQAIGATILIVILGFLYLLPGLIAWNRHHHNDIAILLLNILLGWTILGWIIALVWALTVPQNMKGSSI
jgi:hypothetical protein